MISVLSKIHGNTRRFNSIRKQRNLQREDALSVLGDVIDRCLGGNSPYPSENAIRLLELPITAEE